MCVRHLFTPPAPTLAKLMAQSAKMRDRFKPPEPIGSTATTRRKRPRCSRRCRTRWQLNSGSHNLVHAIVAYARDSSRSEGTVHAAGDARAPRQPVQGRNAAARVRHADDGHGDGECRAQCHSRLSRSGRKRGRHRGRHPSSRGDAGRARGDGGSTVTGVDGRRVTFNVSARDETEEIGRGTHERMVVDVRRLDQRLAAKSKPTA